MKRRSLEFSFIMSFCAGNFSSCVKEDVLNDELKITAPTALYAPEQKFDPAQSLHRLNSIAPPESALRPYIEDLVLLLEGDDLERNGQRDLARQKYQIALQQSQGRFSKIAFKKWVSSSIDTMEKPLDKRKLAEEIWRATDDGQQVAYFRDARITDVSLLERELLHLVGQDHFRKDKVASDKTTLEFPQKDYRITDPLLKAHSEQFCSQTILDWKNWNEKLPTLVKKYWIARVAHCQKNYEEAAKHFESVISDSRKNKFTQFADLALESAYQLTSIYRWIDKRQALAESYAAMVEIWGSGRVVRTSFDSNDIDSSLRQINDYLWASRYQGVLGEYDRAEKYAYDALKIAETLDMSYLPKSKRQIDLLKEYRAEGHHILAFRIALEKGQLESALAQTELALSIKGLSKDWIQRLSWYNAFYEYLNKDYEKARSKLEDFLGKLPERDSYREKIYFWLSKSYESLGRNDEADLYRKALQKEFPLSYYTVVPMALQDPYLFSSYMTTTFGSPGSLLERLQAKKEYDLSSIRTNTTHERLLVRAQILTRAQIADYTLESVHELNDSLKKNTTQQDQDLYLSRLYFLAGDYHSAIVKTTALGLQSEDFWSAHPEQILVYFPIVFGNELQRSSSNTGVSAHDILAVTRQESSFRSRVRSPAGALGLMQLMPETARRLLENETPSDLSEALYEPEFNMKLGSRLLSQLFMKYKNNRIAPYAAYNAGEYVVDLWMERRQQNGWLEWIETIPFGETAGYVRNVWRNYFVYQFLSSQGFSTAQITLPMEDSLL